MRDGKRSHCPKSGQARALKLLWLLRNSLSGAYPKCNRERLIPPPLVLFGNGKRSNIGHWRREGTQETLHPFKRLPCFRTCMTKVGIRNNKSTQTRLMDEYSFATKIKFPTLGQTQNPLQGRVTIASALHKPWSQSNSTKQGTWAEDLRSLRLSSKIGLRHAVRGRL